MGKTKIALLVLGCGLATATAQAEVGANHPAHSLERYCAEETGKVEREGKMSEAMAKHLSLNDAQKAALKDFEDARAKAIETIKSRVCAEKTDLSSFEARLRLHQRFLEDRLEALKIENPKLIAFYNTLDEKQKATFDNLRDHLAGRH
jgi:hypothetical protein